MQKISIGVDIENISKFENYNQQKKQKILKKIFTDFEIKYCLEKINPAQHLAARFAAKEAIIKAMSSKTDSKFLPNEIEIRNKENGKPEVVIKNNFIFNENILISMSHNDGNAIAFAVILNQSGENWIEKN